MEQAFKNLKRHATKRIRKRLEIQFNRHIYRDACDCISQQKTIGVCTPVSFIQQGNNKYRSLWMIKIKTNSINRCVIAVYDRRYKAIATFMPPSWKLK
jgi:hypothetical protein